jgi:hypothetical protein
MKKSSYSFCHRTILYDMIKGKVHPRTDHEDAKGK